MTWQTLGLIASGIAIEVWIVNRRINNDIDAIRRWLDRALQRPEEERETANG